MRELPQWVASAPSGKPINVRTGYGAKINEPGTWSDFDAVAEYCATHDGHLPAFALTESDPYVIIDLDNKEGKPASDDDLKLFDTVLNECNSYTERSRSGRGWHIVLRGTLDAPVKSAHIEVYDRNHFMTFTGDVPTVKGKPFCPPVIDRQRVINSLVNKLAWRRPNGNANGSALHGDLIPARPSTNEVVTVVTVDEPDEAVIERATADPVTGERFSALRTGDWSERYDSQSEADLAYVGMLWNASGNVDQVEQLFRSSDLYRPDKERKSKNYIAGMLNKVSQSPPRLRDEDSPASMYSDLANAKRLQHHFGDQLLYAPGAGWLVWDGARWDPNALAAQRLVSKLGRVIMGEAGRVAEQAARADNDGHADNLRKQAELLFKHAGRTENAKNIDAAMKLAAPLFECNANKLDADPRVLGCTNGVVDLRTAKLSAPDPSQYITQSTGRDYDPAAQCPTWDSFLARIFRKHPELPAFMQRLAGYWLTGLTDPPYLAVLYGVGANGKTTLVETISHVMGDYASTAPRGLLAAKHGNDPAKELAALHGKRLVVTSETTEVGRLDEELIKAMTGSDRITARRLYKDYFTFDPTHKLALLTNHKPIVRGQDEGIWRRLLLVPFDEVIPKREQDLTLKDKLQREAPGILAWMVKGAQAFLKSGITLPKVVTDATSAYRSESDVIGAFIAEECEVDSSAQVPSSQLYLVYDRWCADNGERALPKRTLGMRLQDRGITSGKGAKGLRMLRGIALRDAPKF